MKNLNRLIESINKLSLNYKDHNLLDDKFIKILNNENFQSIIYKCHSYRNNWYQTEKHLEKLKQLKGIKKIKIRNYKKITKSKYDVFYELKIIAINMLNEIN